MLNPPQPDPKTTTRDELGGVGIVLKQRKPWMKQEPRNNEGGGGIVLEQHRPRVMKEPKLTRLNILVQATVGYIG